MTSPDHILRPASLLGWHAALLLGAAMTLGAHVAAWAVGAGLAALGLGLLTERAYWLVETGLERRLSLRLFGLRLPRRRRRCGQDEA